MYYHSKLMPSGNLVFVGDHLSVVNLDGIQINTISVPGVFLEYEVIEMKNGNYLAVH